MPNRTMILLSLIVTAAMASSAVWAGLQLPDGPLPIHWGLDGRPDGYAPKWVALLLSTVLTAATMLLFAGLRTIEPRRANLARSSGFLWAVWIGSLAVLCAAHLLVLGTALHWPIDGSRWLVVAIGVLFTCAGDQLGKSRPMYLAGIRTRWTLANEDIWIATHRFGGKAMVLAGLAWIAAGVLAPLGPVTYGILIALELSAVMLPIGYSYLLWRRAEGRPA